MIRKPRSKVIVESRVIFLIARGKSQIEITYSEILRESRKRVCSGDNSLAFSHKNICEYLRLFKEETSKLLAFISLSIKSDMMQFDKYGSCMIWILNVTYGSCTREQQVR